jgi:SAM-dependent methyltransferase
MARFGRLRPVLRELRAGLRLAVREFRTASVVVAMDAAKAISIGTEEEKSIPAEFDWRFYRACYRDLRTFDPEQLAAHYQQYGKKEGRCASAAAIRENFIKLIPDSGAVLEIGPFYHPVTSGDKVRYFDVLDSAGLKMRAETIGADPKNIPSLIHYVSPTGELSSVPDRFEAVISSHCIEHQPDLIKHLQDVAELLVDRGCYFLLIPNKRYCFDHFIDETTIADVIDAHVEHRRVHALRSVIEHRALTTHNDAARHWRGDHADPDYGLTIAERTRRALGEFTAASGNYIDVHAWQFTPESFREITALLCRLGYSSMRPLRVYDSPYGTHEFTAILQKCAVAGEKAQTSIAR